MKRLGWLTLAALLVAGCGGGSESEDDGEDKVEWSFTFTSGACSCCGASSGSCSCGGATIQVSGKCLVVEAAPWSLGAPTPWTGPETEPEREAIGRALELAPEGVTVIDATAAPEGVVALVRSETGEVGVVLLGAGPEPAVLLPGACVRVVPASTAPTVVRVHLEDGAALLATRTR